MGWNPIHYCPNQTNPDHFSFFKLQTNPIHEHFQTKPVHTILVKWVQSILNPWTGTAVSNPWFNCPWENHGGMHHALDTMLGCVYIHCSITKAVVAETLLHASGWPPVPLSLLLRTPATWEPRCWPSACMSPHYCCCPTARWARAEAKTSLLLLVHQWQPMPRSPPAAAPRRARTASRAGPHAGKRSPTPAGAARGDDDEPVGCCGGTGEVDGNEVMMMNHGDLPVVLLPPPAMTSGAEGCRRWRGMCWATGGVEHSGGGAVAFTCQCRRKTNGIWAQSNGCPWAESTFYLNFPNQNQSNTFLTKTNAIQTVLHLHPIHPYPLAASIHFHPPKANPHWNPAHWIH